MKWLDTCLIQISSHYSCLIFSIYAKKLFLTLGKIAADRADKSIVPVWQALNK